MNTSEITMVEELHFSKEDKVLEIKLRRGSAENEHIVRNGKVYELIEIK